jgi:hypothetical protein
MFVLGCLGFAAIAHAAEVTGSTNGPRDSTATADLAATSSVPWNPSQPMNPRRPWEQALLLPGRLISLPLVGLGYVTERALLFVEQSGRSPLSGAAPGATARRPLRLNFASLGDRSGIGPAVEVRALFPAGSRVPVLRARYEGTTRLYNRGRVVAALGPAELAYGVDWRPGEQFSGIGLSTSLDSLSDYATQTEFVRGALQWGWQRDSITLIPRMAFGVWGGPRTMVTRTGRDSKQISFDARFPAVAAAVLDRHVDHLVYGGSIAGDWRSGRPHWGRGGRVAFTAERFAPPTHSLALRTGDELGARFVRISAEGEAGFSFMRDPRTVRLFARVVDQNVDAGRDRFLLADMASLGGREGLAGYAPGRFHDLDKLVTRVTYVFPIVRRLEVDVHAEWGAVYADVWRDARLASLRHSVGVALRGRGDVSPHGAFGVDVSPESVRLRYTLGGVE